ncbi:hypothetical protein BDW72DRAFT_163449 [Aspergillus terricola var. indicus]
MRRANHPRGDMIRGAHLRIRESWTLLHSVHQSETLVTDRCSLFLDNLNALFIELSLPRPARRAEKPLSPSIKDCPRREEQKRHQVVLELAAARDSSIKTHNHSVLVFGIG